MVGLPKKHGLYDPKNEKDSCGVGFVAQINGKKSHEIVKQGLNILERLHHRGAVGADPLAGDGAGILLQIPDDFLRSKVDFDLPEAGKYGVGMIFVPKNVAEQQAYKTLIEKIIIQEGLEVLGWRLVPVSNSGLGYSVLPTEPDTLQVFIGSSLQSTDLLERKLFVVHKQISSAARAMSGNEFFYINSMSARTIVYKGMLLAGQVGEYFLDLLDESFVSALALVHQRFSTNTFPTWDLAHPFRMIAHNGEINTFKGNANWMAARKHSMKSKILGDDISKIWPIIPDGQSDSASLDNVLELLIAGGYSLAQAMMLLIPEAWQNDEHMPESQRSYYEYNAAVMEPWDGPAAVVFTDGKQIGATLDRNGLRPARYLITDDGLVVMASEMGVLDIPENKIIKKWRLQPGKMFLIDLEKGEIIDNEKLKSDLADAHPYGDWLNSDQINVEKLSQTETSPIALSGQSLLNVQQASDYSQEDIKFLLAPMLKTGVEATGSMGTDVPPAVMSNKSRGLSNYFKQNFAQVTNPPIDPMRESIVMSLMSFIGPKPNILDQDSASNDHMRLETQQPILSNNVLDAIRHIADNHSGFVTKTIDITYPVSEGATGLQAAIENIQQQAEDAVNNEFNIVILSDRLISAERISIPALLATSSVHQHLIDNGLRTETGLIVETAAAIEVHHFSTLAGFGAEAINPWLAFDTIDSISDSLGLTVAEAKSNYTKAIGKGLLKVMSKMGISTYQSYCGAKIFDSIGLSADFVDKYFTGVSAVIEGIGLIEVAQEAFELHNQGFGNQDMYKNHLAVGGDYAFRTTGEKHIWNPETIANLQQSVRGNNQDKYNTYAKLINEQTKELSTLRGLIDLNISDKPIALDEVEPAKEIVKRFVTGAMSFGSISYEAHSTLAIAMNQLGGKSNTGEGGEEKSRFMPLADGSMNPERSSIKQVASGRFGVTTEYLVNSDEIQIKMAQGAKPGEGGQLPGHKVNKQIASVRHSTEGVGLISPPPHHDIYSIEDLAQLIYDLKNVQPKSRVSVKLVSEVGVGTIAAGVSKAHADHITISGFDGGTGASPLTSIKHTGLPWEIGLAETHQTLVLNKLRSRTCVQADGGLRTGRDVVIAALLGADEFGFATAPLIAEGCVMMRKCHLNTCPVGVATQDPELRKKFKGKPEHVVNYFFFVAEEIRQLMSELGFRSFEEMVGRRDKLSMKSAIDHWKAKGLDYSSLLFNPEFDDPKDIYHSMLQDHGLDKAKDNLLIEKAAASLSNSEPTTIDIDIFNYDRSFGTMLSGRVAENFGHDGLPENTITINAKGTAGQSLGAWLARGITINLSGTGNDYVAKGLSGGKIIIKPAADSKIDQAQDNIIAGNTLLFGAISGEVYLNGTVGERFCVRNSGAHAVVEGIGDHGCEYMTGGVMLCIGNTGRNFAAGMSGGIAYVLDLTGDFASKVNSEMVDLSSVAPSTDTDLSDMLSADEARIKSMLTKHVEYTQSKAAQDILDNWDVMLTKFIKVMPQDYKRALMQSKDKSA